MQLLPILNEEFKAHHCLENVDKVSADPEVTDFKRRARLQQALWREAQGFPIGTQPMCPKPGQASRPLGSRMPIDFAKETAANFLDNRITESVHHRLENPEPQQTLNENRLWCDLLSSMPMCFNLFGSLHRDLDEADRAVHTWWPDVPGKVSMVRFEWSPGRSLSGEYLENRSAFDAAFEVVLDDGSHGIVGVETKYHEHSKPEKLPRSQRLVRYEHVTRESGVFQPEALSSITGTRLQQIWLDHLLVLSMLQHPSCKWSWTKFVLVHPAGNPSYAKAAEDYRRLLTDSATFGVSTVESLLEANVLRPAIGAAFKKRYLW